MAALLTNMKDLEGAYDSAMNADGSAMRENEKYLDSIQGKMDLLKNSAQTFAMNTLNSEFIKTIVSGLTTLVQILDTIPGKFAAIGIAGAGLLKHAGSIKPIKDIVGSIFGSDSSLLSIFEVPKKAKNSFKDFATGIFKGIFNDIPSSIKRGNVFGDIKEVGIFEAIKTDIEKSKKEITNGADLYKSLIDNIDDVNERINAKNVLTNTLGDSLSNIERLTDAQRQQGIEALNAAAQQGVLSQETTNAMSSSIGLRSATNGLKGALSSLWGVIAANPLMALVAAVTLAAVAFDALITTAQEASDASMEKFNTITDAVGSTESELKSLQDELAAVNEQISALDGGKLSFADSQELQRLKQQRGLLENNISMQESMLDAQKEVQGADAAAAMQDLMKATSATRQESEGLYQAIGMVIGGVAVLGGLALAAPTGGTSLAASAWGLGAIAGGAGVGAIIGGMSGKAFGGAMDASQIQSYDDWYAGYKEQYEEASKAAEDAYNKYMKDPGDMDKRDNMLKAKQATMDIQSEMYNNLAKFDQLASSIDYGKGYDDFLNTYYDFRSKMSMETLDGIPLGGAKANAIERIFGENASSEIQAIGKELDEALDMDGIDDNSKINIADRIAGIPELQERLDYLGITAQDLEDYYRGVGEVGAKAFWDLSDAIADANTAQVELEQSLKINPDKNYETRNTAMKTINDYLNEGRIGSESAIWNIAESMGFTYDSAKSIEENATALDKWYRIRDEWYKVDDKGNVKETGATNFLQDAENAVKNSEKLQELGVKWDYNSKDKSFEFDFNNMKFDDIIKAMSETNELAGITKEEFIDMMTAVGQFYDVEWGNEGDLLAYMEALGEGTTSLEDQLNALKDPLTKMLGDNNFSDKEIDHFLNGSGKLEGVNGELAELIRLYRQLREQTEDPLEFYAQDNIDSITDKIDEKIKKTRKGRGNGKKDVKVGQDIAEELSKGMDVGYSSETGNLYVPFEQMNKYAEESGVTVEELQSKLEECGKTVREIKITEDDPLGIQTMEGDINGLQSYLTDLGIQVQQITNADGTISLKVNAPDLATVFQEHNLTPEQIQSQLEILGAAGVTIPIKNAQGEVENVNVNTAKAKEKIMAEIEANPVEAKTNINIEGEPGTLTSNAGYMRTRIKEEVESEPVNAKVTTNVTGDAGKVTSNAGAIRNEVKEDVESKPVNATVTVNTTGQKGTTEGLKTSATGTFTWTNNAGAVNDFINKKHSAKGEVAWDNNMQKVKTSFTATGTVNWTSGNNVSVKVVKNANGTVHLPNVHSLVGTANASGSWGIKKDEKSLVGELGAELVVRGDKWFTVGDAGPEFTDVKRGDIIFNHKQTQDLFKHGYVTSRGKAYAEGTAYAGGKSKKWDRGSGGSGSSRSSSKKSSKSSKSASKAAKDFSEIIDFIEIKLTEINEDLDYFEAKMKNYYSFTSKNKVADSMLSTINEEIAAMEKAIPVYESWANKYYNQIPSAYRAAAKDGSISIKEFQGEANEKTVEAIKNYREWSEKVADLRKQLEETKKELTEISMLKLENIEGYYSPRKEHQDNRIDNYEAQKSLTEERGEIAGDAFDKAIIERHKKNIEYLKAETAKLQESLDDSVRKGYIVKYSNEWYEAIGKIEQANGDIIEAEQSIEESLNAINDAHWDRFEQLISRYENIADETSNLLDVLSSDDLVDENTGKWTDKGITSLGLYAQQMNNAEAQAKAYQKAISELNSQYAAGRYSESEYNDKLAELKDGLYDSIDAYNDAKESIVDLNEKRVDAIKDGIEKEIDAYEDLIDKKQEELDAEKD